MSYNRIVKLRIKKLDGEFCVQWIEGGEIDKSKCYYTDCKQDAIFTVDSIKFENYSKQNNIFFN